MMKRSFSVWLEEMGIVANKMEARRKAPRLTNKEGEGKGKGKEETLDADVWGNLQEHIPLQTIYEKLSQEDLFHLRLVNKEWNHAALQWILPEPSFVTIVAGLCGCRDVQFLNGIVTYNSAFGKFKFDRQRLHLPYVKTHVPPFEVEGLILCHRNTNTNGLEERGVFNVHNQTWHAIPPCPRRRETLCVCGLLVDTSVKPYTFKLIEGSRNFRTQIYDSKSRSWSRTPSRLPYSITEFQFGILKYSCVCHNGNVYISLGRHKILKYSLEDDKWTDLKFPKLSNYGYHLSQDNVLGVWAGQDNVLGVWAGRIFTTRDSCRKQRVIVWELVDDSQGQEEWVEYARMSKAQYEMLLQREMDGIFHNNVVGLRSFFRNGYLLIFVWRWQGACANVLVLFDMATKLWQKVDLPWGTVAAMDELESSLESEDFEEAEADQFDGDDQVYEDDHFLVNGP